jgi:SAM-dependent methyltransferase
MSPAAALLMDGHSSGLRAWLDLEGAGGRMDQAFAGLLDVVRSGKPAYPAQFGREFWADLGSSPELARSFDTLMAGHSQRFAPDVVAAYDWAGVRLAVDVGGGTGGLLAELVRRHPHIEGVLVDQASAAATARQRFADEGISDRATVVVGDFFGPLPSSGSAYLLARILHDWSDRDAVRILRNCATAGGPDSRVLVIEAAPAADADISRLTSMDLRMLVVYGGRERTTEEIAALADQAGLATHTTMSTPSGLTIVDMRRAPA